MAVSSDSHPIKPRTDRICNVCSKLSLMVVICSVNSRVPMIIQLRKMYTAVHTRFHLHSFPLWWTLLGYLIWSDGLIISLYGFYMFLYIYWLIKCVSWIPYRLCRNKDCTLFISSLGNFQYCLRYLNVFSFYKTKTSNSYITELYDHRRIISLVTNWCLIKPTC